MRILPAAFALAFLLAIPRAAAAQAGAETPVLAADCTALDVLRAARAMLPDRPVELAGTIVLRNRRGIPISEHSYTLEMRRNENPARLVVSVKARRSGEPELEATILRDRSGRASIEARDAKGAVTKPAFRDSVLGTDVTWLDLTLDFLWWSDAEFEAERESESVHGQKCVRILVKDPVAGGAPVRIWADRKTGCLMQAEEPGPDGKPARRLWGTRIRKFDGRWSVSAVETERPGSGHRTRITVESIESK